MKSEKDIENRLKTEVKKMGGIALKFVSPGYDGVPDRIVLLPGGRVFFIEMKAPGKTPGDLQKSRHRMLRRLGFKVFIISSYEQIGEFIREIQSP